MSSSYHQSPIYQHPIALLQQLIRFNTTNPPGNEAECIEYINTLLTEAGIQTTLVARNPKRPNLIARLKGQGRARPLLLQGHVDVVPTEKQVWQYPPFEGRIADGFLWGRGTLDMKGGVAMMIAAFLRAKAEDVTLPGDIILTILSDEEAGGEDGARFLVEEHPDLFKDVRYALGEFGGSTMYTGGRKFYPIQVVEKQVCWMKATIHGPGGHGSLPMHGGAAAKLGHLLQQLDTHRLPPHITSVARQMIEIIAEAIPAIGPILLQLLDPSQTDAILDLLGAQGVVFDPLLHNTVNVTILQGGSKVNVIPSEITIEMDGRLLPSFTPEDMIAELHQVVGNDADFEVVQYDPGVAEPDMGMFGTLADILREADPEGIPMPLLMPAVTDGRFFSRLGIQTYGFIPMQLPEDFHFMQSIHAADERIPVDALDFGSNAIFEALKRNNG